MAVTEIDTILSGKIHSVSDFLSMRPQAGKTVVASLDTAPAAGDIAYLSQEKFLLIDSLPASLGNAQMSAYISACGEYEKSGQRYVNIPLCGSGICTPAELAKVCGYAVSELQKMTGTLTPTARKNFVVMLLYRLDTLLSKKPRGVNIVGIKTGKPREYLFYCAAARLGSNVLLLPPSCASMLSANARKPNNAAATSNTATAPRYPVSPASMPKVTLPRRTPAAVTQSAVLRRELSYEEIARLSASVVQIFVLNSPNEIAPDGSIRSNSGGSGVMISESGYILTNHHVVRGGRVYGVRIENEDKIYFTNRVIKYHDDFDLALIRIDRRLSPLPIYRGAKPLVRGQRVAAIGSPLGLFNTVSDGIISGFRDVDGLNMIQFTAPISPGSSGGAVLNMSGEVIGISSAGLDTEGGQAQNINLAVGYDTVLSFCGNIIDK